MVELRWRHVQESRRAANQFMQILDVVFSELRFVFRKTTASWASLYVLRRFPNPRAIA